MSGRWRSGKRPWARSTPTWPHSLNNLARLYYTQGQYAKAEPLYQRALAIREKALGPEHPDVARASTTWRLLYDTQGQYAKAEPLYQRALAIREKALGPGAPRRGHEPQQPGAALRHPRPIREGRAPLPAGAGDPGKGAGPGAPRRGTSLNNLAGLYDDQGQYAKAEPLYQRALAIREKALGPEHPDVATCLENYALLLRNMGRPEEAAPLELVREQFGLRTPD